MRGEQAIFNLEVKKKSGSSINPDIHHSKVPSSDITQFQLVQITSWVISTITLPKRGRLNLRAVY